MAKVCGFSRSGSRYCRPILSHLPVLHSRAFLMRERRSIGTENERCLTCLENTTAQLWCGTTSRSMRREPNGKRLCRNPFILAIRSAT